MENTWTPREIMGFKFDMGWGNGYVILDNDHPLYGKSYDEINIPIHGGLTYAGPVGPRHLELCDELFESDLGKWMIGFDTAHCDDSLENCPEEYVRAEAQRLLDLVAEYR